MCELDLGHTARQIERDVTYDETLGYLATRPTTNDERIAGVADKARDQDADYQETRDEGLERQWGQQ